MDWEDGDRPFSAEERFISEGLRPEKGLKILSLTLGLNEKGIHG